MLSESAYQPRLLLPIDKPAGTREMDPGPSRTILSPGAFAQLERVENCLCQDGRRRTVTVTGEPETFFSVPARTQVNGKTVTGFITGDNDEMRFIARGRNNKVIPLLYHVCDNCRNAYLEPKEPIFANFEKKYVPLCWTCRPKIRNLIADAEGDYGVFSDWCMDHGFDPTTSYTINLSYDISLADAFIKGIIEKENKIPLMVVNARFWYRNLDSDEQLRTVLVFVTRLAKAQQDAGQMAGENRWYTEFRYIAVHLGQEWLDLMRFD